MGVSEWDCTNGIKAEWSKKDLEEWPQRSAVEQTALLVSVESEERGRADEQQQQGQAATTDHPASLQTGLWRLIDDKVGPGSGGGFLWYGGVWGRGCRYGRWWGNNLGHDRGIVIGHHRAIAKLDLVAVAEWLCPYQATAVDEGTVGAAQVFQKVLVSPIIDDSMAA